MKTPTQFLSHSVFQTRYGLHECPIIYFGIVAAVKSLMKTQNLGDQTNHHSPRNLIEETVNCKKPCKKYLNQKLLLKRNTNDKLTFVLKYTTPIHF